MVKVAGHGTTDRGRVRPHNEDAFLLDLPHGLFAVADGMGGHAAGEVASRIAIDALEEALLRPRDASEDSAELLRRAIEEASRRIAERSDENPEFRHMGTTIVAALLDDQRLSVAHVGDSRAYLVRGADLLQLTSDHSFVNELVRLGMLSPEQAARDPRRNVVTRALGGGAIVSPDLWQGQVEAGEALLLCSDGLTTMLTDKQILEVLRDGDPDQRAACERLVAAANAAGGEDNITVVLLGFHDDADPARTQG